MHTSKTDRSFGCATCIDDNKLDFDFTMAFQPIVNTSVREVFAQEALARGLNNESAGQVFKHVNNDNRYSFDQACRVKTIELAVKLGVNSFLSINFMPNAIYHPERCLRTTLQTAHNSGFPIEQIIFEFTEDEKVDDYTHLREIIQYYKQRGFRTAIDDFGAGYSGLNLLAEIQTDLVKLDMALIRNINKDKGRQVIVKGIMQVCNDLAIQVIAEGVESYEEMLTLQGLGIELFQGYYFARPAFQALPLIPQEVYGMGQ